MAHRRKLFLGAAILGLAYIGYIFLTPVLSDIIANVFPEPLAFEALEEPKGFRRVAEGDLSAAQFNPLVGIDGPKEPPAGYDEILADVRSDPCRALFGDLARQEAVLPIASFSDYYCPYCRIQTVKLGTMAAESEKRIEVVWHELPLLGETSMLAAKAALAAEHQGAYVRFHERLLKSPFGATEAYFAELSENLGIDHDQLVADMNGPEVEEELQRSAALAQVFGFVGTPTMVVGRTVVEGTISDRQLDALIAAERERLEPGWCAPE